LTKQLWDSILADYNVTEFPSTIELRFMLKDKGFRSEEMICYMITIYEILKQQEKARREYIRKTQVYAKAKEEQLYALAKEIDVKEEAKKILLEAIEKEKAEKVLESNKRARELREKDRLQKLKAQHEEEEKQRKEIEEEERIAELKRLNRARLHNIYCEKLAKVKQNQELLVEKMKEGNKRRQYSYLSSPFKGKEGRSGIFFEGLRQRDAYESQLIRTLRSTMKLEQEA